MDDRMGTVDEFQIGIVDAAAQIISYFIVGRKCHPGKLRLAVG
jgi:hypothetical protein